MADTRTPSSRRASNLSASRLPSTRERRPALAALAVILIVGGAFASGFLALQAGNRADYLQVRQDVPQGAELTEDDLTSVSLPEDMDGVIPAGDEEDVVGLRTTTHLLSGTILTERMVTDEAAIEEGMQVVTMALEEGDVAPDIEPGAAIVVWDVPDDTSGGGGATAYDATIVSVDYGSGEDGGFGEGGTGSSVQVKVLMTDEDAAAVQAAIEDDRVRISETAPPAAEGNQNNGGDNGGGDNNGGGE